jgi:hypothetical protein
VRQHRRILEATGKLSHYDRASDQRAIGSYLDPQIV